MAGTQFLNRQDAEIQKAECAGGKENERMKVLIVGGVAAGTKVAAKLMREDRSCEVTILTKGKDISYAGCGLPYYVGGLIPGREQLIVNTPESFSKLTGAQVQTGDGGNCGGYRGKRRLRRYIKERRRPGTMTSW